MGISATEDKPDAPAYEPPNFREDERLQARYASMLERRIKTHFMEHESAIRRNASAKRDELRAELDEAQAEWRTRSDAADAAREAYREAYPHHVKKMRLEEPSVVENVRSLGAANKLYRAATESWHLAEQATSNLRRIEHNETQLDIELKKALERAPVVSKEVTESEKWLAEVHAEEEMAEVKAKLDAIAAERASYAERLATGTVPADEMRVRSFAERDVKPLKPPVTGVLFLRVEQYGPKAYLILRDTRKALYALPYDRRFEPILDGVFDIVLNGKEFQVRRSVRDNGPLQLSPLDHFLKCSPGDEPTAQEEYRQYQEFVKAFHPYTTVTDVSADEAAVMQLLAEFAATQTR